MDDPRICIVGAGNLSSRRIYPYIGAAGGILTGVCDLDVEKAARMARRFGGKVYSDLDVMLREQKPDGVMICTGPKGHAALAPKVMKAGIPVYTEKPPGLTAADTLAVAKVARETGVLCTTAFKKRYAICNNRAKQFIDALPAGELYSISIDYGFCGTKKPENHYFLFDFCIHCIDLACYLMGEVSTVYACAKDSDAYAVSVRFKNGAVGSLHFSHGMSRQLPKEEVEITARGGQTMSIHNSSTWRITTNEAGTEWREPPTFISAGDSGNDTGHLAEIVDFFAAIREKRTTRSNIFESYKSMLLYEAIVQSSQTERVVSITYEALKD